VLASVTRAGRTVALAPDTTTADLDLVAPPPRG
jgi:hypothetical protein